MKKIIFSTFIFSFTLLAQNQSFDSDTTIIKDYEKLKSPSNSLEADSFKTRFFPNYEKLNNFNEMIQPFKDSVIFVDIWATWCGPCIEEFFYQKELVDNFKNKPVVFLYISLDLKRNEEIWKEIIYENRLQGIHLIANETLINSLEKEADDPSYSFKSGKRLIKVRSMSIPRYLIIDKNGRVVVKKAKNPSDKIGLYKQIEQYL